MVSLLWSMFGTPGWNMSKEVMSKTAHPRAKALLQLEISHTAGEGGEQKAEAETAGSHAAQSRQVGH